jgi:DhnA family fructose-bisphosphate aldolase class Ia
VSELGERADTAAEETVRKAATRATECMMKTRGSVESWTNQYAHESHFVLGSLLPTVGRYSTVQ